MIEASASTMAKEFHEFLDRVEHGETVRIGKHGRAVARLVPDANLSPVGKQRTFSDHTRLMSRIRRQPMPLPPRFAGWSRIASPSTQNSAVELPSAGRSISSNEIASTYN
jgi:prevent-host-death family protein